MLKPLPSLRQLRYLVALADHLHFGKAAEICLATQSTLSAALAELESTLGVTLVERTRRRVMMTPLGEQVTARARVILRDAEDLYDLTHAASAAPLSGVVRLGVIPTIAPYLLPAALPGIRQQFPDLTLHLREDMTARLLERLNLGELDLVLMALPWPTEGMETMTLAIDPFAFVCLPDHPLAGKASLSTDDLAGAKIVLLEEGHCLRDHALNACRLGNSGDGLLATSLTTLVQMVANGIGVTVLPALAIQARALAGTTLTATPLRESGANRLLGLVWRQSAVRKEEFRLLGQHLAQAARNLLD